MIDKSLTIKEVEDLRSTMNTKVAEAIKEFEDATGLRTRYIDIIREKDIEGTVNSLPSIKQDCGEISTVNINLNMDF